MRSDMSVTEEKRVRVTAAILVETWLPTWVEPDNTFVLTKDRFDLLLQQVSNLTGLRKNPISPVLFKICNCGLMKQVLRLRWLPWRLNRLYSTLVRHMFGAILPSELCLQIAKICVRMKAI